ncbi:SUKH-4 family immunity protein [Streptomyces asiaticus]
MGSPGSPNSAIPRSLEVPVGSVGEVYRASERLECVAIEDHGEFLKFGSAGMFGSILLDPRSGQVMESGRDLTSVSLVNTSLQCFISCVRGFIGCFPFYSRDSDSDEWESVAQKIEELVCRLDPEAYHEDSFWFEVRWSVATGDFATEDLT